jgi:hypothetical protein
MGLRRMQYWVNLFMVTRMMALTEQQKRRKLDFGQAARGVHHLDWMSRTECAILNGFSLNKFEHFISYLG